MLAVQAGFPILDSIVSLILTMLEALKGYFSLKITKFNNQIKDTLAPPDVPHMNAIGFTYAQEEEMIEEEYEDE